MKKRKKKRRISDAEFDAMLSAALFELHREKMDALPPKKEPPKEEPPKKPERVHRFSEKFEHRIINILEDYQNQFIPNTNNKIKKSWVLSSSLIIVMILCVNAGANRTARTHFVVGTHKDHSEVNYEVPNMELAPKEILDKREPEWGEEYEEIGRIESQTSIIVRMSKKYSDSQVRFIQQILSIATPYINTEFADLEKDLLELNNGKIACFLIRSDVPILFWNDGEYYYVLEGIGEITELLQLANSIQNP